MRLYFFNNMYLGGIQAGIQAGHAAVELMLKYGDEPAVKDWAENHKTFIILNGGDSDNLHAIYNEIMELPEYYYAAFREPGVNNSLTSIALLVPESVYEAASVMRSIPGSELWNTSDERAIKLLNTYGLFR